MHAHLADNRSFLTPCLYVQTGAETRAGLNVKSCLWVLLPVVVALPRLAEVRPARLLLLLAVGALLVPGRTQDVTGLSLFLRF